MKKIIFALIICVTIYSCTKKGGIAHTHGTKLIAVEYDYIDRDDDYTEYYKYNEAGQLQEIEEPLKWQRKQLIDYKDGRLHEVKTYETTENQLIFRDSIVYNTSGNIDQIFHFSGNAGAGVPLSRICEFEYDSNQKLVQKITYALPSNERLQVEKYYWNGDNIERVEHFHSNGELLYEFFYAYDNRPNYKKDIPTNLEDPITWTANNVTSIDWRDYLGNWDWICRPCESNYQYNLDDYPVKIETNTKVNYTLMYE